MGQALNKFIYSGRSQAFLSKISDNKFFTFFQFAVHDNQNLTTFFCLIYRKPPDSEVFIEIRGFCLYIKHKSYHTYDIKLIYYKFNGLKIIQS